MLIGSTIVGSWFGLQAVHESGHVIGALASGGKVSAVVLWPLTISRTNLAENPHPLIVVWAGPIFGVLMPILLWRIAALCCWNGAFVLRFFAGFCLIANGAYIAFGSWDKVGDCGEMLLHGSRLWQLWLFGAFTMPTGLWLWHRQGPYFGIGPDKKQINPATAYTATAAAVLVLLIGFLVDGA